MVTTVSQHAPGLVRSSCVKVGQCTTTHASEQGPVADRSLCAVGIRCEAVAFHIVEFTTPAVDVAEIVVVDSQTLPVLKGHLTPGDRESLR